MLQSTATLLAGIAGMASTPNASSSFPRHIFFELGLNRGQTLMDLLTSTGSDRNLVKPLLSSAMQGQAFDPRAWCFHGFEANPVFTEELVQLEGILSRRHRLCVRLQTQVLAGSGGGAVPFYIDGRVDALHGPRQKYFAEGSTMDPDAGRRLRNYKVVNVTSIDFAAYLEAHLLNKERRPGMLAVMRMDIEGGEYTLLPHLLRSREGRTPVICKLDLLVIEFHSRRISRPVVRQHQQYRDQLQRTCPLLRVALDPANYEEQPWKRSWPRPVEWSHLASINPYSADRSKGA